MLRVVTFMCASQLEQNCQRIEYRDNDKIMILAAGTSGAEGFIALLESCDPHKFAIAKT
jgi:hypothetical protein